LTRFESGEVVVGSETLTPESSAERIATVRRQFGMIFQNFQLFPHLTAVQNVMEAPLRVLRQPAEEARAQARQLLDRIGLGHRLDAFPKQLSGGQQQRVAIARALAMEPRGLLCDEITSALDPELKGEVLDVITDLKQEGLTVIMVTHEIHFARRAADHVVVLADGGIVEHGPPDRVIDDPQVPRTQRFLSQVLA
jgi:ABC-type polar amino acid transport system ATPase subunit